MSLQLENARMVGSAVVELVSPCGLETPVVGEAWRRLLCLGSASSRLSVMVVAMSGCKNEGSPGEATGTKLEYGWRRKKYDASGNLE